MTMLPNGVRRLFRLPQSRERLLREMDDEVRAHIAMRTDELRALGMSMPALITSHVAWDIWIFLLAPTEPEPEEATG